MMESTRETIGELYDEMTKIGSGGGGVIFKAYHKRLKKYVVLKEMRSQVMGVLDERLETDILKDLHHKYLPQVFDFLTIGNQVYTVMDFIEGSSFDQLIYEGRKFSRQEVLKYTEQLCEVMAYLHKRSTPILHGDIKPANIMLRPDGDICLIDFNIAGFLSDGAMVTLGYSAGYASPEQYSAVQSQKNRSSHVKQPPVEDALTELLRESDEGEAAVSSERKTALKEREATLSSERKTVLKERGAAVSSGEKNVEIDYADGLEALMKVDENDKAASARESVTLDNSAMKIDLRADVYSIGATMYHLATGICPSTDSGRNPPLDEASLGYSNGFAVIINKAMESEPGRRFADADEMLRAVKKIYKYDKNYKALIIKQEIAYAAVTLFVGMSVFMFFQGGHRMRRERIDEYGAMIAELTNARETSSADFEELYDRAAAYMPEKLDAHYQKAVYLAEQGMHEECIRFIQENLLGEAAFPEQAFAADVYYMVANCFFELEEYDEAAAYYEAAVEMDGQVSRYYGDYAISLAYCGRMDEADEVLKKGRERGMGSDYVLLVSAEIEFGKGMYDDAITHFKECIDMTENRTIKFRAYVLCDKAFRKKGETEEILLESVELLTRAATDVEPSDKLLILERLAQDYMDLGTATEHAEYDSKALEVLDEIVKYGWGNDTTQMNKAILLEKLGRLDEAETLLKGLAEQEPDNYVFYKRLSVLEADMQGEKPKEERDYRQFEEYYQKTMELYENTKLAANDVEIQWLEQAYSDLKAGGWME